MFLLVEAEVEATEKVYILAMASQDKSIQIKNVVFTQCTTEQGK